jgi:hypothetical protein
MAEKRKRRRRKTTGGVQVGERGIDLACQRAAELEGLDTNETKGRSALARLVNVSRFVVNHWNYVGVVSTNKAPEVSDKTGIPLHKLNPKVYPEQLARSG